MNQACASLVANGLPEGHWPYAEEAAVHIINFTPSYANPGSMSPHERWACRVNLPEAYIMPLIRTLRTWACRVYVYINNKKL